MKMLQSGLSVRRAIFLFVIIFSTNTIRVLEAIKCHQCSGIQCLRTSYSATVQCSDILDVCVSIFRGQTLLAQGCLEEVSESLRAECHGMHHQNCQICDENLCNHMGPRDYECLQCDSNEDISCRDNPDLLEPSNCPISHSINAFCFASVQGNRLKRGCATQLSEQLNCLQDENCVICSPFEVSACNRMQLQVDNSTTPTTTTTTTPPTPSVPPVTPTSPGGNTTSNPTSPTPEPSETTSTSPSTEPTKRPGGSASTFQTNEAQIIIAVLAIYLFNCYKISS